MNIQLTPPSMPVFIISVVLAVLALVGLLGISIPIVSGNSLLLLAIAYVVLLAGVVFRGA